MQRNDGQYISTFIFFHIFVIFFYSFSWETIFFIAKLSQAQTEASVLAEISFNFAFTPDTEKVEKFPLAAFLQVKYSANILRDSRHSLVH